MFTAKYKLSCIVLIEGFSEKESPFAVLKAFTSTRNKAARAEERSLVPLRFAK